MRVSEILVEGKRRKDLVYETTLKAGEIDRVIVKLSAKESEGFTKLAKEYVKLRTELDAVAVKVEKIKTTMKTDLAELFDPADDVLTRVTETASLTLTLAKAVQPSTKTEVDYKKAYDSLVAQLTSMVPELAEKVKEISDAAVKAAETTKTTPGKSSAFTVKEGFMGNLFAAIKNRVGKWLDKYDKKLATAKAGLAKLKSM